MTKTDNEKYVKRGAGMFIEHNPEWKGEVSHANEGGRPVPVLGDADHAGRRPPGRAGSQVQAPIWKPRYVASAGGSCPHQSTMPSPTTSMAASGPRARHATTSTTIRPPSSGVQRTGMSGWSATWAAAGAGRRGRSPSRMPYMRRRGAPHDTLDHTGRHGAMDVME